MDILSLLRAMFGYLLELINFFKGLFTGKDTSTTAEEKFVWNK